MRCLPPCYSRHFCTSSTAADISHFSSSINSGHLLSVSSQADHLASDAVSPPVHPWPCPLTSSRLVSLLRRLPDPTLCFKSFHYSLHFSPNFTPSYPVYATLIHRLASSRSFHLLPPVLSLLRRSGYIATEKLFSSLIHEFGLASRPVDSLRTFLSISSYKCRPTVRSFNALLLALIRNRHLRIAAKLFRHCHSRFEITPNVSTCNLVLKALCGVRDLQGALNVLDEMPRMGLAPDLVSYTTIISCHCARGNMPAARAMFDEIIRHGIVPDETIYTVLAYGYCCNGCLEEAVKIMDEMELAGMKPNEITYSAVIEACVKENKSGEALNLLDDMLNLCFVPTLTLCCKVTDSLCADGKVVEACEMWLRMLKKNILPDNAVCSTLIYWLCKKGKVLEGIKLFDELGRGLNDFRPTLLMYNTLIMGACENGYLHVAAKLWNDMLQRKCSPNVVTYDALIKGFCKAGKAKEAVSVLEEMVDKGFKLNKSTLSVLVEELCQSREEK